MTLATGTKLGPYEILSPLGAGGMGEVYRAKDTRLGRDVAVKVLPEEFFENKERVARFEREAKLLAALNHPNVAAIHSFEEIPGSSGSFGRHLLVMELLEGETLRHALSPGPLPVKKLLGIAAQIADGLAKAHEAGIVHRDLKPENVMVTKDGFVKILDFGLAKLVGLPGEPGVATHAPTVSAPTEPGVVLGTVAYMSPEQAAGKPIDFRSDQFSFGSILYEMLTGRRAFTRGTAAETLAAIIREEPEPVGARSPGAPLPLRWVMERCLAKDPEERYASTRDLARDVAHLRDHLSDAALSTAEAPGAPSRRRPAWAGAAAALILLAAVAAALLVGRHLGKAAPPSFHQLTFRRGTIYSARFAPDGQTIVYGASWDGEPIRVFSARPESPESRLLDLPSADVLSVSSLGEMLLSLRLPADRWFSGGTLARAALAGGAPREILEDVQQADWAPDGTRLAIVRLVKGESRLEFPIGTVLHRTTGWISEPRVSPGGDLVSFLDHSLRGDTSGSVATVDLRGNRKTLSGPWYSVLGLSWSPGGAEIWFTATQTGVNFALYAVSRSGGQRLLARVAGPLVIHDVSRDGRALLTRDRWTGGMMCLAPGQTWERDLYWFDQSGVTDISPDGRVLLFFEGGEGSGKDLRVYLRRTDGSPAVRLGTGFPAALSPDGRWVLSISNGSPAQIVLLPTGAGESKPLARDTIHHIRARWLPSGDRIVFAGSEPGRGVRLYVQDLAGGEPRPISPEGIDVGEYGAGAMAVSADGRRVAAIGPDRRISLYPVEKGADPAPRPVSAAAEGDVPVRWSADGAALFAYQPGESPVRVLRLDLASGRREVWKEVGLSDPTGLVRIANIQLTPDGKSHAYSYIRVLSELYLVEGLR